MPRQYRKRKASAFDAPEEEGGSAAGARAGEADLEALRDVRCLQQARARARAGRSAEALARGAETGDTPSDEAAAAAAAAKAASAGTKGADDPTALRDNFAADTALAAAAQGEEEDPRLRAFLAEEMAKQGLAQRP